MAVFCRGFPSIQLIFKGDIILITSFQQPGILPTHINISPMKRPCYSMLTERITIQYIHSVKHMKGVVITDNFNKRCAYTTGQQQYHEPQQWFIVGTTKKQAATSYHHYMDSQEISIQAILGLDIYKIISASSIQSNECYTCTDKPYNCINGQLQPDPQLPLHCKVQ